MSKKVHAVRGVWCNSFFRCPFVLCISL